MVTTVYQTASPRLWMLPRPPASATVTKIAPATNSANEAPRISGKFDRPSARPRSASTREVSPNDRAPSRRTASAGPLHLDLAFRPTRLVRGLREHRGPAIRAAVGELVPRAVTAALDARPAVHQLALRQRAALMRAGVVQRVDALALSHHDERLRAGPRLRRRVLGDVADVERLPLRPTAPPGVAVDLAAHVEHELAAQIGGDGDQQEADAGEPHLTVRDERRPLQIAHAERYEVEDGGDQHQRRVHAADALALAAQIDVVGVADQRRAEHGHEADGRRPRRAGRLPGEIEDEPHDERADGHVGDERMQRMSEPRAVQQIPQRWEWSVDRAEDLLEEISQRVGPDRLGVDDRREQLADHARESCTMRTKERLDARTA